MEGLAIHVVLGLGDGAGGGEGEGVGGGRGGLEQRHVDGSRKILR